MARRSGRRRKQGSTGEGLVAKAFGTLFIVLIIIGSFLLFFAWLHFERKGKKIIKPISLHDFDHTKEELRAITQQEKNLVKLYSRLDQIEFEGQSITKRQDGMYNERSSKGKLFNNEIRDLNPKIDNLEQALADLESLPEKRLNEWTFYASMHLSLRLSVISYISSIFLFTWLQPKWIIQLSAYLQKITLLDFYASFPVIYGASTGSLIISLIVLTVSFFYFKNEKKEKIINSKEVKVTCGDIAKNYIHNFNTDELISLLSQFSHADLKKLADDFNIVADRRSKANILDAISNEDIDVINRIYSQIVTE